ncbi:MAG: threonylcarbamoyl-AMP synthase [Candidatus Niyogibacteria bacterium RIFCSPLOWO2_12_FULL_41_13]|uniref:L-threonylcarbamoyladenylate synthase n=1 Tax=Candidatus Niyogibacteria bacterium RIFCSPLOWO2_12_FULL_41_13 TaxID=1801726 RepID=A0A1G2F0I4_9BACT|nr:MAG: threonylcarbamoyl-AMP synthase [Candidatus Niyogibacteria bacterium RIFCSPLOWO2_12_FULL_41_13]
MEIVSLEKADVDNLVGILRNDGVIVVPTDTVYGLAANALSQKAVSKVLRIKGRKEGKPLPVFISSLEMLDKVAVARDEQTKEMFKKVWPGKATLILSARGWLPMEVRGNNGLTTGVRIPNYPWLRQLMDKFGGPITGTSANVSGFPAHTKIKELIEEFNKLPFKPDIVVDAGALPESQPSAVIDCTVSPPQILRKGEILLNEL